MYLHFNSLKRITIFFFYEQDWSPVEALTLDSFSFGEVQQPVSNPIAFLFI